MVDAGGAGDYTVRVTITYNDTASLPCEVPSTVNPNPMCLIDGLSPVCPSSTPAYSYAGPSGTYTFLWSITGNGTIPGATTDSSVTVNAGSLCNSNFILTLTVTSNGCPITCSQPFLVNDTAPPKINCAGPQTIECPATPSFPAPTVHDDCDPSPTLTFVDVTTPGTCPESYSVKRTWTATDHCGNSASCSQTITVVDTHAPTLSGQGGPQTIECPAAPSFTAPMASDTCDPNPMISFTDSAPMPGNCPGSYSITRTWTAKDACGNTSLPVSQTITVEDITAPTIGCPPNIVVNTDGGQPAR